MPFALVFIGLLLIVTGAKDTYKEFGASLIEDFTGPGNFTWWIVSVGAVGSLGYVPQLRSFSRVFMALIILSMLLAQQRQGGGGFFGNLEAALRSGPVSPQSEDEAEKATGQPLGNAPLSIPRVPIPASSGNSDAQSNFNTVMQAVRLFFSPV